MVVDSSAIIAILLDEPEKCRFVRLVAAAREPSISAASLLECAIVMHRRAGATGFAQLDGIVHDTGIRCIPVDLDQALAARRAWVRYGKGNSPAGLNFGDCFSYALARTMDRPLLFKGGDFTRTDVRAAE
ncbi:type II toxin-antitoxin system VapC family toxin [Conexibacter arvalis]|uniref:Ribonuclease VapC n=1 Tax=Conexibacter arvalis TaxID=912552 RepID=A0A840I778_9ACTN|nr:type II toxin-antitoxin system VapC family toxin [Conexibacter arvalis]MBB4660756.1 ribonuclease VapC [Conexibacter arvalis]